MSVIFKEVPDYPRYRVGDDGSVWSLREGQWVEMKCGFDKDGYKKLCLKQSGKRRYVQLHSLILEVFVGPRPDPKTVAAHANGIRSDNRLCNLRWDSQKANVADALKHGTFRTGERHYKSKLTTAQVREIREAYGQVGITQASLARKYGVTQGLISWVVHKRHRKSAPGERPLVDTGELR